MTQTYQIDKRLHVEADDPDAAVEEALRLCFDQATVTPLDRCDACGELPVMCVVSECSEVAIKNTQSDFSGLNLCGDHFQLSGCPEEGTWAAIGSDCESCDPWHNGVAA